MNTRRLSRPFALLVSAAALALLVAACGGSRKPPPSSASTGGSSQNSGVRDAYRYSACMRTHGVTNFQDPHVKTNGNSVAVAIHVDPAITGSPAFKSAQKTCAHILPNGGNGPTQAQLHARTEAILAFAKCMRQHGFPRFPDPNSQGQLPPAALAKAGINLQQPAIKPAADACASVTHRIITKADINQAIANPNGGAQSSSGGG
ncbi:MAG: hypothetical protein KGL15_03430 [Acidobacteriota bacterium]|nr:hypothetical protein [Acidobacteriota bacterium]